MRPITKGTAPRVYSNYQDAINDLETRFGRYCSYCERHVPVNLAVEHVSPKKTDPNRKNDWSNFLIACTNCNSAKGDTVTNDADFLWPDKDNTMLAIEYIAGGIIRPSQNINQDIKNKAEALIDLVGLDRHPGMPPEKQPTDRDKRYADREAIWKLAQLALKQIKKNNDKDTRKYTIITAMRSGFFSIWMSTFKDDKKMRRLLIKTHTGTAKDCFDSKWVLQNRKNGHI